MKFFLTCTLVLFTLTAVPVQAADVEWEGWSFDFTTSNNSSGLVLTDVQYNSKTILSKASMPVMRVKYDNDICGPYADILGSSLLRNATQGAPDSACNNEAVCQRTFTRGDEKILEVGSNWQIGEYQLYQTYYFSENGYFDARIYSRGLQCTVDHSHHAHWMFDFDIDGSTGDRIRRDDDAIQTFEFNDQKSDSNYWTIEDSSSDLKVRLSPAVDDGTPNNFAKWDLAVRAYNSNETRRWNLGARGEIGENYLNNENINEQDLVVWYVSHLPHSASEGSSLWHASGPRISVLEGTVPPNPEPVPPVQPPIPSGDNLLANGNFESSDSAWFDCGPDINSNIVGDVTHQGSGAMLLTNGGCLYQEVGVATGTDYSLSCQAERSGGNWTIMELSFLDASFNSLASETTQISTTIGYTNYTLTGTAPATAVYALALLYSEDQTRFDSCVLQANGATPPPPIEPTPTGENLLTNGGFEQNLSNWNSCSASELVTVAMDSASGENSVEIQGGGCLYQEFDIEIGQTYFMDCQAKRSGQQYTSATLALLDNSYAALQTQEIPVTSAIYQSYTSTLSAPPNSKIGTVVVYSEDPANFDDCTVVTTAAVN